MNLLTHLARNLGNSLDMRTPGHQEEEWDRAVKSTLELIGHLKAGGSLGLEGEEEFIQEMINEGGDLGELARMVE